MTTAKRPPDPWGDLDASTSSDVRMPRSQSGEVNLAFALMADALRVLDGGAGTPEERAEAAWWFLYDPQPERPCSLAWCCAVLNMDPAYVQRGIRLNFPVPPSEACREAARFGRRQYDSRLRRMDARPWMSEDHGPSAYTRRVRTHSVR